MNSNSGSELFSGRNCNSRILRGGRGGAECLSSLFCGIRIGTIREVMDDDATISGIDSCDMGADRTLHAGIVARNCKSGNA